LLRAVHIDSQLQWSLYSRALVDAYSYILYVLYYGSRTFSVVPKRVFQSVEQPRAFKPLLAQHVSNIVNKIMICAGRTRLFLCVREPGQQ
jgi:hypothetical protein